jgi:hypothetical protein
MRVTGQLPRSWFAYSERTGPPIGASIQYQGRWGTVAGVRESGDMLEVEIDVDDDVPDALTGVPGVSEDQLSLDEDDGHG